MGKCPHKRMGVTGLKYNPGDNNGALFNFKNICSFIYFWLHWVFVVAGRLSPVSGGEATL